MKYEFEWQYSEDPVPPPSSEPYIHFVFMLRFPDVPPGRGHVAHFCFNVLWKPGTEETGIRVLSRGFVTCNPYSKPDVMEFVEAAVREVSRDRSRDEALDLLNTKFINQDLDFSDEFACDLLEAEELLELIERAFDGVDRGEGVTLHQATVIGDYGSEDEFVAAKKLDTESRWQDVPDAALATNEHSLRFLDAAGFRYYLPAKMSWSIRNFETDHYDSAFFTYLSVLPTIAPRETGRGLGAKFDLEAFIREHAFNPEQVNAIYRFICFMAIRADFGMDEDHYAAAKKWQRTAQA